PTHPNWRDSPGALLESQTESLLAFLKFGGPYPHFTKQGSVPCVRQKDPPQRSSQSQSHAGPRRELPTVRRIENRPPRITRYIRGEGLREPHTGEFATRYKETRQHKTTGGNRGRDP